jgi:hypothetical protein
MFLADAGQIALTLQSDRFTVRQWSSVGIDPDVLSALSPSDFEVVGDADAVTGTLDGGCERN